MWAGLKFRDTQGLYNFTPADTLYGNKLHKMLGAGLLNIEKIGALTGMPASKTAARLMKKQIGAT